MNYKGKLIIVEGLDGSGKSTQLALLRQWLVNNGKKVYFTEWNSSPLIKGITKLGKSSKKLSPKLFSLLHCSDLSDRYERFIEPLLSAGYIVLCDRYIYTAYARDYARGLKRDWLKRLYSFAPSGDLKFYFKVDLDIACKRILERGGKPKYYESGMDLNLAKDRIESFKLFQERVYKEYERISQEENFFVIDGTMPALQQQHILRSKLSQTMDLNKYNIRT